MNIFVLLGGLTDNNSFSINFMGYECLYDVYVSFDVIVCMMQFPSCDRFYDVLLLSIM